MSYIPEVGNRFSKNWQETNLKILKIRGREPIFRGGLCHKPPLKIHFQGWLKASAAPRNSIFRGRVKALPAPENLFPGAADALTRP